jgi:hypothetical protein
MQKTSIAATLAVLVSPANALENKPVTVTPVLKTMLTIVGQPIVLPQKNAEVIVSIYDIAPGAVLPQHKHHYPRYGYVLSGTLTVTNLESGKRAPSNLVISLSSPWTSGTKGAVPAPIQ